MKRSRFCEEQIIGILRQTEAGMRLGQVLGVFASRDAFRVRYGLTTARSLQSGP